MPSYYGHFEPLKGNEPVEPIASSYARPRNKADPRKKKPGCWRCLKLGSRPAVNWQLSAPLAQPAPTH